LDDKGVRVVNFYTSKNLIVKSTAFPLCSIDKYTWTSPDGQTHCQIDHLLMSKRGNSFIIDVQFFRGSDCGTDSCVVVAKFRERLSVSEQAA
jgi:hypothetical protein